MKGFFDTSILVPVFYGDHVHHQASLALFIQFDKSTGCCGAHSLAEVYSTLTRMPGKHRISGQQPCCSSAAYENSWPSSRSAAMSMPMRWRPRPLLVSSAAVSMTPCL